MTTIKNNAIKADLKRVARKLNTDSLSRNEYRDNGNFSSWLVESRFGNWTRATKLAKV